MKKSQFRILYSFLTDDVSGWAFDEEEFETTEDAFETAMDKYPFVAFRIVKLIYPQDD
jgi:hypothetical protein